MSNDIKDPKNELATPKDVRRGCLTAILLGTLIYSVGIGAKNERYNQQIEQIRALEELNRDPRYVIYKAVKKVKKAIYEHLTDRLFF